MLDVDYDAQADVLYVNKEKPRPSVGEVDEVGLLLRYALDDETPCGVTVVRYRDWVDEHEELSARIARFLSVTPAEIEIAILVCGASQRMKKETRDGEN